MTEGHKHLHKAEHVGGATDAITSLGAVDFTGTVTFGADTNLYRSAANILKTDDAVIVSGANDTTVTLEVITPNSASGGHTAGLRVRSTGTFGAMTLLETSESSQVGLVQALSGRHVLRDAGYDLTMNPGILRAVGNNQVSMQAQRFQATDHTWYVGTTPGGLVIALNLDSAGKLVFGPSGLQDTNLYRSAANTLKTDDKFVVGNVSGVELLLTGGQFATISGGVGNTLFYNASSGHTFNQGVNVAGDLALTGGSRSVTINNASAISMTLTNVSAGGAFTLLAKAGGNQSTNDLQRWVTNAGVVLTAIASDGKLLFGASGAQDTNLYRSAANTLKTDDEFIIGINGGKDTLALTDTTADVGLTIGADVTLYRSAADTLKTDDEFVIGINGGKDTLALTDTTANVGMTIGADTNLYREAADILATDDKLHVVGELEFDGALNHDGTTVGFYATAPITQAVLATGAAATVDDVITALQNLGLVKQS